MSFNEQMTKYREILVQKWKDAKVAERLKAFDLPGRWKAINWRSPKTRGVLALLTVLLGFVTYKVVKEIREHGDHEEEEHGEGHIELTEEAIKNAGIEVAAAGPGELKQTAELPGEVVLHPSGSLRVSPRYAGVVREISKNLGDTVAAGDTLAIVESNAGLQRYPLKTSMAGIVTKRAVSAGEHVSESVEAFAVANLEKVFVNLTVYQADLAKVQKGQSVKIIGNENQEAVGTIFYVSPVIDSDTRTGTAAVELPNPELKWRPGFFVTGKVTFNTIQAPIVIPREALQYIENETAIFIKDGDDFEKREVEVGEQDDDFVEITEGLKAGESYVTKGAFTLKSELSKGSVEHAH